MSGIFPLNYYFELFRGSYFAQSHTPPHSPPHTPAQAFFVALTMHNMATGRACVVVVFGLAVFALVVAASPAQSGLFTATSGANLWTYPNPAALAKFEARVVPVPVLYGLWSKLVAAAASGEPGGGFTVVTTNAMAVQRPGRNFTSVDFGGQGFLFTDVAYVPSTGVAPPPSPFSLFVAFALL